MYSPVAQVAILICNYLGTLVNAALDGQPLKVDGNGEINERLLQLEEKAAKIDVLEKELNKMKNNLDVHATENSAGLPADCLEILTKNPGTASGPQRIDIGRRELPLERNVYCDMETDGGGWTVIQRRLDGSINFFRDYETYARGFGFNFHEFWIGNENLHLITSRMNYELMVELENYDGRKAYAKYSKFSVDSACNGFMLHVDGYSGTAGDGLNVHDGMRFTTFDRQQDNKPHSNCAIDYQGAWWYNRCHHANLNGMYLTPGTVTPRGVTWRFWFNEHRSLKSSEMKIRPALPFSPL